MQTSNTALRDELIDALNDVVTRSENAYLQLGRRFPELLREMRAGLEHSRSTIASLEASGSGRGVAATGDANRSLTDTLNHAQKRIGETVGSFEELHSSDDQLLERLRSQLDHLSALDSDIAEIKDDSIEMELVSLNAMTVALKSGTAGRAFSYITEELKRISESTIRLTEEITRRGTGLHETFQQFRDSLQNTSEFQDRLSTQMRERLERSFTELRDGVNRVVEAVRGIHARAEEVTQPLNRIMEEIQLHDVIKQSIDHVIISLRELSEVTDEQDERKLLDELRFLQLLPELCGELLDDVAGKLEGSVSVFREQISTCRSAIEAAERDRETFVGSTSSQDGLDLHALYQDSSELIEQLLSDLGSSLKMKDQVTAESKRLLRDVGLLEDDFETFTRIITRFRSIDVASRIEVAKQHVLQQMSDTVGRMNSLTKKIERDVDRSLQATKRFISETSELLREHQAASGAEQRLVRDFQSDIKQDYARLYEAERELLDTLTGFTVFTGRFMSLFDEAGKDLDNLESLLAELRRIKDKTGEVRERATAQMQPLLQKYGADDWQIGNQRLQAIIERFTIFTHKVTAGELAGFEVEGGVGSGEVTLF